MPEAVNGIKNNSEMKSLFRQNKEVNQIIYISERAKILAVSKFKGSINKRFSIKSFPIYFDESW